MNDELVIAIERFKEVKNELLENFSSGDEAIKYLVKETNLSEEECSNAYDILFKIDFSKNIEQ